MVPYSVYHAASFLPLVIKMDIEYVDVITGEFFVDINLGCQYCPQLLGNKFLNVQGK